MAFIGSDPVLLMLNTSWQSRFLAFRDLGTISCLLMVLGMGRWWGLSSSTT